LSSSSGAVIEGDLIEFDVTGAISGDGVYSFAIQKNTSNLLKYSSKEKTEGMSPQLVVELLSSPSPVISSFSPVSGIAGTETTLFGLNFSGTTAVSFNGTPAASFAVDSDTQIRAEVSSSASTGKIAVTNVHGTGQSVDDFIVMVPPTITSFVPTNGPVGTEVTLTGSSFGGITGVSFNGTAAIDYNLDSDTRLRAVVPPGATTGVIQASNVAGTGTSDTVFVVTQIPSISSFSPASGPEGTEVTIAGTNFLGTLAVGFNSVASSSFVVDSDIRLRAVTPVGASTGKIAVSNSDGTAVSEEDFVVIVPPIITAFTPTSGPVAAEVTLNGSGFSGTTDVAFNGISASIFSGVSDAELLAQVPQGAGTGPITVTNAAGTGATSQDFEVTSPPSKITFVASDDASVSSSRPRTNYGSAVDLEVRTSARTYLSYLKFMVTGVEGSVLSAKLHLQVIDQGVDGGSVYLVANEYAGTTNPWTEGDLNWNNAPLISSAALGSVAAVTVGQVVEFDVTTSISGNGTFSFAIQNQSANRVRYASKENDGGLPPKLVIEVSPGSSAAKRGSSDLTEEDSDLGSQALPKKVTIESVYPNPFNLETVISYALPQTAQVSLSIFNIIGQRVRTLVREVQAPGFKKVRWNGRDDHGLEVASGSYLVRLQVAEQHLAEQHLVRKVTLVK
jgi:hypothetical protein